MNREVAKGIVRVGVQDPERRLFDSLIPLPDGTGYNCYLVKGEEKTALIDAVDPHYSKKLLSNLLDEKVERLDYLVANHAEQDHAGAIPDILDAYPMAVVLANEKCARMLMDHLHIPSTRIIKVVDGQIIGLGGMSLKFIMAPWVHWPETMLTYVAERKALFTCDLFGSHLAYEGLYHPDEQKVMEASKRYYAEIMMPFRRLIPAHMEKIAGLDIDIIAPSHGPLHKKPFNILGAYRQWTGPDVKNTVVIPYVSMHGSTKKMVDRLEESLIERGVDVQRFDLVSADIGELAMSLVDAATVIIATPTVLAGPHPLAAYACLITSALRPKTSNVSAMISYGWGGRAFESIKESLTGLEASLIEPVIIVGSPGDEEFKKVDELAKEISERHSREGLM